MLEYYIFKNIEDKGCMYNFFKRFGGFLLKLLKENLIYM